MRAAPWPEVGGHRVVRPNVKIDGDASPFRLSLESPPAGAPTGAVEVVLRGWCREPVQLERVDVRLATREPLASWPSLLGEARYVYRPDPRRGPSSGGVLRVKSPSGFWDQERLPAGADAATAF